MSAKKMEELPMAFVSSLRVLFEILDEDSDGFVELREIEKRWQGDTISGLPAGVVDSLRGIAPKDGRLSFDRFCTGLKITLEKHRTVSKGRQVQVRRARNSKDDKQPTTATVRPNNVVHPMRSKSAPQLQDVSSNPKSNSRHLRNSKSSTSTTIQDENLKKTADPPDYAAHMQKIKESSSSRRLSDREKAEDLYTKYQFRPDTYEPTVAADRKQVEATLKSWQQEKRQSEREMREKKSELIYEKKQDHDNYAKPPQGLPLAGEDRPKKPAESHYEKAPRRTSDSAQKIERRRKKDEPRRHTLTNGIDYGMLKRMKQLEQERDTFLQGLEALELTREWYHQQLGDLRERQERLSKAQIDFNEDIDHQDMVAFRTSRITEINRQLRALITTPEKGFPNHMNLAINNRFAKSPSNLTTNVGPLVDKLKQQNKLLTQEVSLRSDRISALEQEKAAIIMQLFEARGRNRELPDNTTFL